MAVHVPSRSNGFGATTMPESSALRATTWRDIVCGEGHKASPLRADPLLSPQQPTRKSIGSRHTTGLADSWDGRAFGLFLVGLNALLIVAAVLLIAWGCACGEAHNWACRVICRSCPRRRRQPSACAPWLPRRGWPTLEKRDVW